MKAIVQDVYGNSDVLRLRDIPRPVPGDGEVLIKVRAAGVDQGAWHLMTGPWQGGGRRRRVRWRGGDPLPARR
jgi:NADPH:quinone reductase-like Zn-dependent oxidoreductase